MPSDYERQMEGYFGARRHRWLKTLGFTSAGVGIIVAGVSDAIVEEWTTVPIVVTSALLLVAVAPAIYVTLLYRRARKEIAAQQSGREGNT